jgi:hypothetical protein
MNLYPIPEPYSAGVLLSYKCSGTCKHCLYGCSPRWPADWISEADAELVLAQLADKMRGKYPFPGQVGVNDGVHFTGGEPFLNFPLLLRLVEIAKGLGIPTTFVETNGFWARDDRSTREKLQALREAGLDGILVSANPFILEQVPFERTERAARISREVFGGNAIVYQSLFFEQFKLMGLTGTLPFDEYVERGGHALRHVELFPNGRVPYKMAHLFEHRPAEAFFAASCRRELVRDWHIHVDNYCNYMPGFCGGLSLGDARDLDLICGGKCRGIDLDRLPVIGALLESLGALHRLGLEWGYQDREGGYISKCHLCLEIRRHLARRGEFAELRPKEMYERLED